MKLELTERQSKLFEFVKEQHGEQKRKYTGLPYYTHIEKVVYAATQFEPRGVEAAICHDLIEDVDGFTVSMLQDKLRELGYDENESGMICFQVLELTNTYTSQNLPNVNREKRKEAECFRLSHISPISQTVKYGDIIDNGGDIVDYDRKFAEKYLHEALNILKVMDKGNPELHKFCLAIILKEVDRLKS